MYIYLSIEKIVFLVLHKGIKTEKDVTVMPE